MDISYEITALYLFCLIGSNFSMNYLAYRRGISDTIDTLVSHGAIELDQE